MSVAELNTVDMAEVLTYAYELGDMINQSAEVSDYLYWKGRVDANPDIQAMIKRLQGKKELFEETQRFGHFHPNYHSAKDEVTAVEQELERFEEVIRFKQAEKTLDDMLHSMSETIAFSVSDSIKVPGNDPAPKGGGCGSGGKCSCG
ncbi:YlbF family regulator [Paenibacillus sp. S150]|uniref:YlbF family regulator n=1 Tax=Paenibacillus sp. S150 TaxID=2749826 RepID=UPI001C577CCD|nr:YlbF family regulator [Paenibacillus sp. S150]MBW4083952.1 YlbF family regulator [Paenibacillus sp. S150]